MSAVIDSLLAGAVDVHVHPAPSPFPRRIDAIEAAQGAAEAGMRAIVIKSHHHSTAMDVLALAPYGLDALPVEVFGGIALNCAVGGLNPAAVDLSLAMGGKVVWLPTIAAPAHIEHIREASIRFPTPLAAVREESPVDVWVAGTRELRSELYEIFELIARADAVLASGHLTGATVVRVFEEAHAAGVRRLLVNHPNFIVGVTAREVDQLIELDAVFEHVLSHYDDESTFHLFELPILIDWIERVGAERSLLASDLGQARNPLPVASYRKICGRLLSTGMDESTIRALVATTPARLLGLD